MAVTWDNVHTMVEDDKAVDKFLKQHLKCAKKMKRAERRSAKYARKQIISNALNKIVETLDKIQEVL